MLAWRGMQCRSKGQICAGHGNCRVCPASIEQCNHAMSGLLLERSLSMGLKTGSSKIELWRVNLGTWKKVWSPQQWNHIECSCHVRLRLFTDPPCSTPKHKTDSNSIQPPLWSLSFSIRRNKIIWRCGVGRYSTLTTSLFSNIEEAGGEPAHIHHQKTRVKI